MYSPLGTPGALEGLSQPPGVLGEGRFGKYHVYRPAHGLRDQRIFPEEDARSLLREASP